MKRILFTIGILLLISISCTAQTNVFIGSKSKSLKLTWCPVDSGYTGETITYVVYCASYADTIIIGHSPMVTDTFYIASLDTIPQGKYRWGVSACDNAGNCSQIGWGDDPFNHSCDNSATWYPWLMWIDTEPPIKPIGIRATIQ